MPLWQRSPTPSCAALGKTHPSDQGRCFFASVSPGDTISGALCPDLGSLVRERHQCIGVSPAKGNEGEQQAGET